jgi:Tetratricopeptide Repeats-Sensor/Adenylate and Guanylate cyclase catalytic domain
MPARERSSADIHTPDWWLEAVKSEERGGELLSAFDLAQQGLAEHPDDLWLKHRAVLALARAGATDEAARRFEEYGLMGVGDEDVAALKARIAKDLALRAEGEERRRLAARAAHLYGDVFTETGGYYPAVNAATLWLVAGESARSRELAATVLELLTGTESYYEAATEAEACLLLGEQAEAATALERAGRLQGRDYAAVAGTRRQLRMICDYLGIDPSPLSALAGPSVVHFCGHRIGEREARFEPEAEEYVATRAAELVSADSPGFAYGSLASGADILWAEALLARDCELHVVLPFAREEFVASSVAPSGPRWVERFDRCLAVATTVRFATDDAFLGDDVLFRYASEYAMGLALLRARYLDAEIRQLAIWDGEPAGRAAGTAIDVATWRRTGREVSVISPRREAKVATGSAPPVESHVVSGTGRTVRAIVFGDFQGFSKLTDEQLPVFARRVLGAVAEVVSEHSDQVAQRNTWGDAVYVILNDAAAAAEFALDLQAAIAAIDFEAEGLPEHLALRLGCHLGPVFTTRDPVLNQTVFMGSHVSRTARIEPVTPPGAVYVTEPFAAALVLAGRTGFACDYVGHMDAAKGYGRLRMYRLLRAQPAIDSPPDQLPRGHTFP